MKQISVLVFLAALLALPSVCAQENGEAGCVRIYYDGSDDPSDVEGRKYSVALQNLLGHFPEFRPIAAPVSSYGAGEIDECHATFYIGSEYNARIPDSFLDDFENTDRPVLWMGYSIWKFEKERLDAMFGYTYSHLTDLDRKHRDSKGRPTFFRNFRYKGETFHKYAKLDSESGDFDGPAEMVALQRRSGHARVLAEATHNYSGETLPYALRMENRFYLADIPFTYIHEADRYLILADLLFDVLGAEPRYPEKRPAVFRIEDLSSLTPRKQSEDLAALLQDENVPFHIALIPVFADPFEHYGLKLGGKTLPLGSDPGFVQSLRTLQRRGGIFIWHGVTHQHGKMKNPQNGVSGDDYEFWDMVKDAPLSGDSVDFVLDRLDYGWSVLRDAGIHPRIWEVPHYQASVLDYLIFGRVFAWTIGRVAYSPFEARHLPAQNPQALWYETTGVDGTDTRRQAFRPMSVRTFETDGGQFFPYEIYRDVFGQRVIPENLGYLDESRDIENWLEDARRNRVIRDSWASLFFHPYLFGERGMEKEDFRRVIRTLRSYGYEFVNLEEFIEGR